MAAQRRATSRPGRARAASGGAGADGPGSRGTGTARAVLGGLVAGALMVAPVALLTASPAEAAGMSHPLFDHPLDIHINIGPSAAPQPPADLGGIFGEVTRGIGGLLASGGVPTPAPNHPAGRTGSGSGSRGGSGSGQGGTTATHPAAPATPDPTVDAGLGDPAAIPPTAEPSESAAPSSEATPAGATPGPTATPAGPAHPAVVHGQLISSSDGASIAALDTLAIVLAGVGLVGPPAAAVLRGRRAAR
ncbi:hypothetical protein [Pseudofrankia inefficax]|uniref:Uncharacterized protein n=1 Tax=Pseudofrankia inefficax (strain DSM 45817 / CECT 9037 / DDB 130130 / EuI1c) TaxID=298654 RepID=E3J2G5_PSEI1|nr:hypothetical protein [Pseudofrankia inefficax]ADP79337.1 hypothetical protein FraEuI1c_1265 [Pseudofrankia inefficax]